MQRELNALTQVPRFGRAKHFCNGSLESTDLIFVDFLASAAVSVNYEFAQLPEYQKEG